MALPDFLHHIQLPRPFGYWSTSSEQTNTFTALPRVQEILYLDGHLDASKGKTGPSLTPIIEGMFVSGDRKSRDDEFGPNLTPRDVTSASAGSRNLLQYFPTLHPFFIDPF